MSLSIYAPPVVSGQEPIVLFIHGRLCNGFPTPFKDAYKTVISGLCMCLAGSGFTVVSVKPYNNEDFAAQRAVALWGAQDVLAQSLDDHELGPLEGRSTALMGHSAGGEGVLYAVPTLFTGPTNKYNLKVEAVVALAPADNDGISSVPSSVPDTLVIIGTMDGDVKFSRGAQAYLKYTESPRRYFVGLTGVSHTTPLDGWNGGPFGTCEFAFGSNFYSDPSNASQVAPQAEAKAALAKYVTAFLRWKFWGSTEWAEYFTRGLPLADGVPALTSYSSASSLQAGGIAFAGGIPSQAGGVATAEDWHEFFYSGGEKMGYRLIWSLQDVGPRRLIFSTMALPSATGAFAIEIGLISIDGSPHSDSASSVPPQAHDIRVTLLRACNSPLGCGTPSATVYHVPALPNYVKTGNFNPNINVVVTLVVPTSDFPLTPSELAATQAIALEFLSPRGNIIVFGVWADG